MASLSSSSSLPSLPSLSSTAHNHTWHLRERQRSIKQQCDQIMQLLEEGQAVASTQHFPTVRTATGRSSLVGQRDKTTQEEAWGSASGPWRHYLFRNFTPPQRREPSHLTPWGTFNPLRKVTPMRWGQPGGPLSQVSAGAQSFARDRRNAEAILGERLPTLGNSLLTCPYHPVLNRPGS